jgi:hypothetical protein
MKWNMQDAVFNNNLLKSPFNNIKSLYSDTQASTTLYIFLRVYSCRILCPIIKDSLVS